MSALFHWCILIDNTFNNESSNCYILKCINSIVHSSTLNNFNMRLWHHILAITAPKKLLSTNYKETLVYFADDSNYDRIVILPSNDSFLECPLLKISADITKSE